MLKRFFVLTCFLCALSACSYIKKQNLVGDQADNYQKAVADQPLKMPGTLTSSVIGSKTETLPSSVQAASLPTIPPPPGSLLQQSH
jgi:hypothetical protein